MGLVHISHGLRHGIIMDIHFGSHFWPTSMHTLHDGKLDLGIRTYGCLHFSCLSPLRRLFRLTRGLFLSGSSTQDSDKSIHSETSTPQNRRPTPAEAAAEIRRRSLSASRSSIMLVSFSLLAEHDHSSQRLPQLSNKVVTCTYAARVHAASELHLKLCLSWPHTLRFLFLRLLPCFDRAKEKCLCMSSCCPNNMLVFHILCFPLSASPCVQMHFFRYAMHHGRTWMCMWVSIFTATRILGLLNEHVCTLACSRTDPKACVCILYAYVHSCACEMKESASWSVQDARITCTRTFKYMNARMFVC